MVTFKKYVRAQSLEEAYTLNQSRSNRIVGGMLWMKMSSASFNTAIDLCELGLDTIEETDEAFSIGAMVSLRQIELHASLNAYTCGAAAKAVGDIVGVQFRNMATVGGSIFARFGFSDVLTLFMALDARVELYKGGILPIEEFARMKRDNDILVRVIVPKQNARFSYQAMRNSRTDFPVIACAAACIEGKFLVSVGARPGRAQIVRDEQGLLSGGVNSESAREFAAWASAQLTTGSNSRASAAYRSHLIRVLAERAILEMGGKQDGN